jgi:hypothetical protein
MRKELYRKLTKELQRRLPGASKAQIRNQALLAQALVFSDNCHLPNLALQLPIEGQRENLIQRLRRFLDNCRVKQRVYYAPLVGQMLARWPDRELNLVMDRTDIGQEKSILLLAIAFRYRAIPLSWQVLPFGGTGEALQVSLLKAVQPYLPADKRVMFYGDSEFRAVGLQRYCRQQGWGWQVGVKSDTLFHQGDENWQALSTLEVKPGQRRYLHDLTLTQSEPFGPVSVMVDWTYQGDVPRYIVCHRPTNGSTWRQGRKRFWIEPTFRDWKSYGFDLECSQITDDHRLNGLLLGMATATLWLLHLGDWLISTQRHTCLMAQHRRDYSLFRLGRDYARRSELCAWQLPVCFWR